MRRKFLIFIFWNIITGTLLIVALPGCSIYNKIDDRLHPKPEIEKEANYFINRYSDGKLNIDLTVSVTDGDIAMFYYSCRTDAGWDSDQEVGSQHIVDGKAQNSHVTLCDTKLMVQVVVYNNFRKRSQRHNEMAWLIDIEDPEQL